VVGGLRDSCGGVEKRAWIDPAHPTEQGERSGFGQALHDVRHDANPRLVGCGLFDASPVPASGDSGFFPSVLIASERPSAPAEGRIDPCCVSSERQKRT
jgi:hypothetical protein